MKKLLGLVAAVGMSCLAPTMASASVINFDFVADGTLEKEDCGLVCYKIETNGTAYDYSDDVPGTSTWTFSGYMTFYGGNLPWLGLVGETPDNNPGNWSFVDDSGNNNLSGTFGWDLFVQGIGPAWYNIANGSGLFAGATGTGSSVISITKWYSGLPEFQEVGSMSVNVPTTSVPEPSTTALATVGLMMVGFAAFRRRRADVTRS